MSRLSTWNLCTCGIIESIVIIFKMHRLNCYGKLKIEEMPEETFVQQFRMSKTLYLTLCEDLRELGKLKGSYEIPIELKVRNFPLISCF